MTRETTSTDNNNTRTGNTAATLLTASAKPGAGQALAARHATAAPPSAA